jgi:hypothetical protein
MRALRELEFEGAWRACSWDPDLTASVTPAPFSASYPRSAAGEGQGRFHEHVYACLRALPAQDDGSLCQHLMTARLEVCNERRCNTRRHT